MLPEDMATHFEPLLELELKQLKSASFETADTRKPVALDQQSVGRLSRMDAMQNQAMAKAVDARRSQRIAAIEAALHRIHEGDFGYCEECGDSIPFARLQLDPVFTLCVGCKGACR